MSCLAILAVTAAMIIDGDTVRLDGANARLTGEGNVPFDAPETWRPERRSEAELGTQATGHVRAQMPGELCIIGRGSAAMVAISAFSTEAMAATFALLLWSGDWRRHLRTRTGAAKLNTGCAQIGVGQGL